MPDYCEYFFSRPLQGRPSGRALVQRSLTGPYDQALLTQLRAYLPYGQAGCTSQGAEVQAAIDRVSAALQVPGGAYRYRGLPRTRFSPLRRTQPPLLAAPLTAADVARAQRAISLAEPRVGQFRPLGKSRTPSDFTAPSDPSAAGKLASARYAAERGFYPPVVQVLYGQYLAQLQAEQPGAIPEPFPRLRGEAVLVSPPGAIPDPLLPPPPGPLPSDAFPPGSQLALVAVSDANGLNTRTSPDTNASIVAGNDAFNGRTVAVLQTRIAEVGANAVPAPAEWWMIMTPGGSIGYARAIGPSGEQNLRLTGQVA